MRNDMDIMGIEIVKIKQIITDKEGYLQFFEAGDVHKDLPYDIKRIYYITDVKEGVCRGGHAHKKLKQLLFCPYGDITLLLNDSKRKMEIRLNRPDMGVMITSPVWREMLWNIENSVLCVAASDYYNEDDYIRNYDEYIKYITLNNQP